MRRLIRGAYAFLRDRRVALALIVAVTVYAAVGTVVPQPGVGGLDRYAAWALAHPAAAKAAEAVGLDHAYSTPLFLLLAAWLAAATLACAWERTAAARGTRRRLRSAEVPPSVRRRLDGDAPIAADAAGTAPARIETELRASLARMRLRAHRSGDCLVAVSPGAGLLGSPLLHWSLGLLVVVIAVGGLFACEGYLAVPVGGRTPEVHDSYERIDEGPLFGERHTGVELGVGDVVEDHRVGGVSVGPAPLVAVYRDGVKAREQRTYPNRPLRYGGFLFHYYSSGLLAEVSLAGPDGVELDRRQVYFDAPSDGATVTAALDFDVESIGEEAPTFRLAAPVAGAPGGLFMAMAPSYDATRLVPVGAAVTVAPGVVLRPERIIPAVVLVVGRDPVLPLVYLLFATAALGLALSVLVPARAVWVRLPREGDPRVTAVVWTSRRDAALRYRVGRALAEACAPSGEWETG